MAPHTNRLRPHHFSSLSHIPTLRHPRVGHLFFPDAPKGGLLNALVFYKPSLSSSQGQQVLCRGKCQKRKKEMNEISPIKVIMTTKRAARCGKVNGHKRTPVEEVNQLKEELAHVRYELQALKYATQEFVRHML
jgi:hypothetical protein